MTRLSVQPAIMIGGAVGIWRACVICMAEGGARVAGFDQTGAEGDRGQAVNVKGVFFGAKHVIPHLRAGGEGSINNLSSHAGLVGIGGIAPCHASKGAVRQMTRNDAITCAVEKVRVNAIHPACIRTPLVENHLRAPAPAPDLETAKAAARAAHPIGSRGQADDIARAVVWRASEEIGRDDGANQPARHPRRRLPCRSCRNA